MIPEWLNQLIKHRGEIYEEQYNFGSVRLENPNLRPVILCDEDLEIGGSVQDFFCENCNDFFKELSLACDAATVYLGIVGLYDKPNNFLLITHITKDEFQNYEKFMPHLSSRVNTNLGTEHFVFSSNHHSNCPVCKQEMRKVATMRFEDFFNQGGTILTWDIWKKENC